MPVRRESPSCPPSKSWGGRDMAFDHYVTVGQKRLRCGYTTGTCATAATRAAIELLLTGTAPAYITVETPAGISAVVEVEDPHMEGERAVAAVRKDGGDDPDVTDGALVYSSVALLAGPEAVAAAPGYAASRADGEENGEGEGAAGEITVVIDGGVGVGRVTREGLDQPVGQAAINSTPRRMIAANAVEAVRACAERGGEAAKAAAVVSALSVVVSIPKGVELAQRTFNPRLGIEGGISVLGTSGIVKPMSEDALIASIQLEMRMRYAQGVRQLLVSPGNYGQDFARDTLHLDLDAAVQCSNYLGATIDYAVQLGFESFLLVAHAGKLVKVAAGVMNTHSRVADARRETMAAHAAVCGAPLEAVKAIMGGITTDESVDILKEANLVEPVFDSIMAAVQDQLVHRAGTEIDIQAVCFSKAHGLLGMTAGAQRLVDLHVNQQAKAVCS